MIAVQRSKHAVAALLIAGTSFTMSSVLAADLNATKESIQQSIYEITGKDSATLKFEKGSSKLNSSEEAELKTMLNAVRENSNVKEIMIIAYSDAPYPAEQKSDLPKASRTLAEHRGEIVKKKLHELGASNLKVVSMASKSRWFDKVFITKDAQVKQEAAEKPGDASMDDSFYQALGARLKSNAGPGTVVVVVRHEGQYK